MQSSTSHIIISTTKLLHTLWSFIQRAFYSYQYLYIYPPVTQIPIFVRYVHCALATTLARLLHVVMYSDRHSRQSVAYYLPFLIPHSYASSTNIFVRTSQYLFFRIQIFGIQPSPPSNSRSTPATSRRGPSSRHSQLFKDTSNIPTASARQASHQQYLPCMSSKAP